MSPDNLQELQFILYKQQSLKRWFFCIECHEFIPFAMVFPEEKKYRSKNKSKREEWEPHGPFITWEIFEDNERIFYGEVNKMELGSEEWKICLRALGIEPDKLGTNLNLVDEGVQKSSELSSFLASEKFNKKFNKMSKINEGFKQIEEAVEGWNMLKDEIKFNKTSDVNFMLMQTIKEGENKLFSKKNQDTIFEKARQVADSKPLNVTKREMALLRFVKINGKYEGKDWMELNCSWRGEMKEVTQARISQIISSLIEKEYLETVQTKGSGSSRVVKIPNNLNIDSLIDSPSNNQRINANSQWSKNDDEMLLALREDRNLSVAEIAYEMGRSEASIRSRLATNLHKHSFDAK